MNEETKSRKIAALIVTAFTITALPIFIDQTVKWIGTWLALAIWTFVSVLIAVNWLYPWARLRRNRVSSRSSELDSEYESQMRPIAVMTFGPKNHLPLGTGTSLVDRLMTYASPSQLVLLHTEAGREDAAAVTNRFLREKPPLQVMSFEVSGVVVDSSLIVDMLHSEAFDESAAPLLFDITGGTKAMSVSAYLAAVELGADVCYYSQINKEGENRYELFRERLTDKGSDA